MDNTISRKRSHTCFDSAAIKSRKADETCAICHEVEGTRDEGIKCLECDMRVHQHCLVTWAAHCARKGVELHCPNCMVS